MAAYKNRDHDFSVKKKKKKKFAITFIPVIINVSFDERVLLYNDSIIQSDRILLLTYNVYY